MSVSAIGRVLKSPQRFRPTEQAVCGISGSNRLPARLAGRPMGFGQASRTAGAHSLRTLRAAYD